MGLVTRWCPISLLSSHFCMIRRSLTSLLVCFGEIWAELIMTTGNDFLFL